MNLRIPCLLGLLLAELAHAEAAPPSVVLDRQARVAGRDVLLMDVARVPRALAALRGLRLAPTPRPGTLRVIERAAVAAALRRAGLPPDGFALEGAKRVLVRPRTTRLAESSLVATAQRFVRRELGRDVEFAGDGLGPWEVLVGRKTSALEVRWETPPTPVSDTVRVELLLRIDGVIAARRILRFRLGESLAEANGQAQGSTARATPSGRAKGADAAAPKQSRSESDARAAGSQGGALVREGELVRITLRKGPLVVVARGRALEDGALGQAITLRLSEDSPAKLARVTGPGAVDIVLGRAP
ncbi:MAG: hypothetical protein D6731_06070 [Planctomycetota bacterium]|nr:MAG: hypothetical protein D6731_06070 [Planctomycetota bacterium]